MCVIALAFLLRTQRLPHTGRKFTDVQETAIVDLVIRNNGIKLTEIRVLADNVTFANIHSVSITSISRVLKKTSGQDKAVVHCAL